MKTMVVIACALSVGAAVTSAAPSTSAAARRGTDEAATGDTIISRFLNSEKPRLTSYKARRVLTAAAMGGRMSATLEAWTYLDPDGTFRFDVIRHSGSALIVEHVLVAALTAEQRIRNDGNVGEGEVTKANYAFEGVGDLGEDGLVTIRMLPRRKAPMLLEGVVTVRQSDGEMVRIDGSLSERPSWWTTHVDVVCRYARIAGVRAPVEMSSRADVRVAGDATFSMTYEYLMVNGRVVRPGQR